VQHRLCGRSSQVNQRWAEGVGPARRPGPPQGRLDSDERLDSAMQRPIQLDLFDCPVEQVNKLRRRCGGFWSLRSVTAMGPFLVVRVERFVERSVG
jgi:hypothetical protein